jgi:hypothetical protein
LTWSGEKYVAHGAILQDALPVTLDITMTAADFSNKHLGVSGAMILAAFITTKNMKDKGSLSKLDLSGNSIGGMEDEPGVKAIAEALKVNRTITEINLASNRFDAECIEILAPAIEASGSLSKLTFCGIDRWGDEGDAVTIDTAMIEADFSGKKLGAAGAQVLAAFMSTKLFEAKGSLASLDISDNNIGDAQEAKIKQICAGKSIKFTL